MGSLLACLKFPRVYFTTPFVHANAASCTPRSCMQMQDHAKCQMTHGLRRSQMGCFEKIIEPKPTNSNQRQVCQMTYPSRRPKADEDGLGCLGPGASCDAAPGQLWPVPPGSAGSCPRGWAVSGSCCMRTGSLRR